MKKQTFYTGKQGSSRSGSVLSFKNSRQLSTLIRKIEKLRINSSNQIDYSNIRGRWTQTRPLNSRGYWNQKSYTFSI